MNMFLDVVTGRAVDTADYQSAFRAADITSDWMKLAIREWYSLYYQTMPQAGEDPCQQIPYTIVRKLTKTAFSEYRATSRSNNAFVQTLLDRLDKLKNKFMQKALISGSCMIKPMPMKDGFHFSAVDRGNILVFGRDNDGRMIDIGTAETSSYGTNYYTLLERRSVTPEGNLVINNQLYRSASSSSLGQRVPLTALQKYEQLPEEYTYTQRVGIGMAELRTPMENCVDGSADTVSVYAAAVPLIHNINRNEAQLNGEFERGESRIIVSADMLRRREDGRHGLQDHIFVGLDEDPENTGVTIFSPELREASFLARKAEYLRNVESMIGLKRGLLSEVEAVERTAKEITSSEGDYNLTIIDFQASWMEAVRETVRI